MDVLNRNSLWKVTLPKAHKVMVCDKNPTSRLSTNDIDTNTWPGCGEIDILEYVGREPGEIFTTLHIPASYGSNPEFTKKTKIPNVEDEFHVYKMTWTEESISFFFEDQLFYEYNPEVKNDATWPFDKPFFLIVNMAIGGNFGGPVIDDSSLPATFAVDYIKVYQ